MTTQHTRLVAGAIGVGVAAAVLTRLSRRMSFAGRSVLITGGSRGLGLLIARELIAEGAHVTLAARDEDELLRAAHELRNGHGSVHTIAADIARREEAEGLVQNVLAREGRLDLLINNAGTMSVGPIEHMSDADFEQAMAVHCWGPLHTMSAAIAVMRAQRQGRIVNISSIGGAIALPHLGPYSVSKFALTGLSDAIRAEVAKDGIRVTTVLPGLMRTGSPYNAWFKGRHRDEFTWFAIADSLPLTTVSGEHAARKVVNAARYGQAQLVIGWPAKLAITANALAPSLVSTISNIVTRWLLPSPDPENGARRYSGWQSLSSWAPSRLTRMTDRAAVANNQLP